ncbi:MAG: nicotinate-nucleotide diphosphorylase (carboxylating), partial [Polyangiales bacterium]
MLVSPPAPTILSETVRRALSEDIDRGDITTEACVPTTASGSAVFHSRHPMVCCGLPVVEEVYGQIDPLVDVDSLVAEG